MKTDDRLSEVFGTEKFDAPKGEVIDSVTGEIIQSTETKIEADYDKTRNNLHDLLVKGQDVLSHAIDIAKQSEHPRAFEVVGNLMKQLTDMNQQLLDIHQQKAKLDAPGKTEEAKVTNNNAIFVGSTAEMAKLIKNMNKGDR